MGKSVGSTPARSTPSTRGRVAKQGRPPAGAAQGASTLTRAKIDAAAPPLPLRGVSKPKRLAATVSQPAPGAGAADRRARLAAARTGAPPVATSKAGSGLVKRAEVRTATHGASKPAALDPELERLTAELLAQADDNANLTRAVEEANERAATATSRAAAVSRAATEQVAAFEAHIRAQQAALAEQAARANAALAERAAELTAARADAAAARAAADAAGRAHADELASMRAELLAGERVRREIHDQLHALRGNIRVICRLRPPAAPTQPRAPVPPIFKTLDAGRSLELSSANAGGASKENGPPANAKWSFSFDRVLSESASQEDVFVEVAPLCQSALDGFRVAIFAYGQTGSGKTHTMTGELRARRGVGVVAAPALALPCSAGVIPRSLALLFARARQARLAGWVYAFEASLLEIYNDEIRDLLPAAPTASAPAPPKLELRHERSGDVSVIGLTAHAVLGEEDAYALLERAAGARATARTACNEHSSRSHSVFVLRVAGTHAESGEAACGSLTLVDLAGSERVKESGVCGARLKEAQQINKSLSALGDVIAALAAKERHVPFRNSKLTALLQPSLGGSAKALMVVNVASDPSCWNESLCSLRFAQKASGVRSGAVCRSASGGGGGGGVAPMPK